MKQLLALVFIIFIALALPHNTWAQEQNNKYGIHIIDENDLEEAAELVNSSGGEWGYVTIVIRDDERDHGRWQRVFDTMRRLKLIPIIRIATHIEDNVWVAPHPDEGQVWAEFLDSLLWPVSERYVVLYNEPNHAKEWGGTIDPGAYAEVVQAYERVLRETSDEFRILPAALDLAAPNSSQTMEATTFWQQAHAVDNFHFTRFDIWNSHSYPNPGFSGDVTDNGKMSIQGYTWELEYLADFGLNPEIPVFITETGWIAANAESYDYISENYKKAFETVWDDPQVRAVTPFLLQYTGEPFDKFAFLGQDGTRLPQFDTIAQLRKRAGKPIQTHSYELVSTTIANSLVSDSSYQFYITLKNTGQSIWSKEDGFSFHYSATLSPDQISVGDIPPTEPNHSVSIPISISTDDRGKHSLTLQFNKDGEQIGNLIQANFEIIAPPSLEIRVKGWFGSGSEENDFTLVINEDDRQVLKIEDLLVVDGLISIPKIYNVIPGKNHTITVTKKYHVAKSKNVVIDPKYTSVNFGRLLPLDLNNDGRLGPKDIIQHIMNPAMTQLLISPF